MTIKVLVFWCCIVIPLILCLLSFLFSNLEVWHSQTASTSPPQSSFASKLCAPLYSALNRSQEELSETLLRLRLFENYTQRIFDVILAHPELTEGRGLYVSDSTLLESRLLDISQCFLRARQQGVHLCAVVRNEAPYLQEWLAYQLLIGFEYVHLYNHNSTDHFSATVEPFLRTGRVTATFAPTHVNSSIPQQLLYSWCLRDKVRTDANAKWVAFLDADEYLVIRDGSCVADFLERYSPYASVSVLWAFFCSADRLQMPAGKLITQSNTRRFAWRPELAFVKSFCRPEAIASRPTGVNMHMPALLERMERVDVTKRPLPSIYTSLEREFSFQRVEENFAVAQLNHYWAKSFEDWLLKIARGRGSRVSERWSLMHVHGCMETEFIIRDEVIKPHVSQLQYVLQGE